MSGKPHGIPMMAHPVGEEGLIAAVIAQAAEDAMGAGSPLTAEDIANARAYFAGAGGVYREHLTILDLPVDWQPQVFEDLIKERQNERT